MTAQKYVFALLVALFIAGDSFGQCLSMPNAFDQKLETAEKILEGRVVGQTSFFGDDGNIYTSNQVVVYRVFEGNVGFDATVITEGGVVGDLMQMVTPSVKLSVGDYGVFSVSDDKTTEFIPIDEATGAVYGNYRFHHREALYENIARHVGSSQIRLGRVPLDAFQPAADAVRSAPSVSTVSPALVTAGTKTVLTIQGSGFGNVQGAGHVAFSNADDGGQSFVALQPGPHYLSWTDTEIQLYVPSATLYNNTVAGTGQVRVYNNDGVSGQSEQQVTVRYAKSEVVFNQNLNATMLVGMQDGGYEFSMNQQLLSFLGSDEIVKHSFEKWSCNTGVNFELAHDVVSTSQWAHDDVNLIGLSEPGQLPSYLLGKTITTFSSCGTPNGLQWNMIEVDIVLNRDINWFYGEGEPQPQQFDLETSILHELGHAHLLQHNNNQSSPMYFELLSGSTRRDLHLETDIEGGIFIGHQAENANNVCGEDHHQLFDVETCDLSLVNSISEEDPISLSVYPNPFEEQLTISSEGASNGFVTIYDSRGRTVWNEPVLQTNIVLDLGFLPKGIYLLELTSDKGRITERLVKN